MNTHRLSVPGAELHYEVRGDGPLVLCIPGAPADAATFDGLAELLAEEQTVVAYDQRGFSRSPLADPSEPGSVRVFAEDAARLIETVGRGPALVIGTSGGAITALELATRRPDLVRGAFLHEPPLPEILPDAEELRRSFAELSDLHRDQGVAASMPRFLATVDEHAAAAPMPDFSQLPPEALAAMGRMQGNMDHFFRDVLVPVLRYAPDLDELRKGGVPIAVAIGEASGPGVPVRSAGALAAALGLTPTTVPGDHQGVMTHPAGVASAVRSVFAGESVTTGAR